MTCRLERVGPWAESGIGSLFPGHAIMPGVGRQRTRSSAPWRSSPDERTMQTKQLAGVFDEESSRRHSVQANLTQAQRFSGRSGPGYAWKRLAEGSAF